MTFIALLAPTARAMGWRSGLLTALAGVVIVGIPALSSVELQSDDLASMLRVIAVTGALSVGFLLHDPASAISSVSPLSRLDRQLARVFWISAAALPWWALVLLLAKSSAAPGAEQALPLGGLTGEAVAIFSVALAMAAGAQRFGFENHMGLLVALTLLLLTGGSFLLAENSAVLVPPSDPRFEDMRVWWYLLSVAAALAFLILSRERAPRRAVERWTRQAGARGSA
ncbi:hypothetical protein [Micromonospora sp. RP3T]|uniref:hypothetical protein n=1 Tax=Micromonospora sp. RP3T TaxID=2135446 RepID=UPI000D166E18|nr:hypothetical protein [Micromonospora sp. RP3T]PTA42952.1 hypothetical protein C8054_27985 [Micromonospora sp. RP3T]